MDVKRTTISAVLSVLAIGSTGMADTVMYVDAIAPAGGNGATWEGAYRFLADALTAAADAGEPVEMHVAGGTYRPDRTEATPLGSGDRFATFRLRSGVSVLGGYAGLAGGVDANERDPDLYVTILSGDLAGDDLPGFVNIDENAHHVVIASDADATARLDGLTITGGHANAHVDPACFGGTRHGEPCQISGECPGGACVSLDSTGAGLLAVSGRPWVVDCRIVDNFALFQGAGMMLKAGSDLIIMDCEFRGNRALDNGGALYMGQSSPVIMRCEFTANSGGRYAGASCNRDHSNAQFIECVFTNNTAAEETDTGGGAIVNASSSPTIEGCTFIGNRAIAGKGGAVYGKRGFSPELGPSRAEIIDCTFDDNEAGLFGGAVYGEEESETTIRQSAFTGNAAGRGGAVYTTDGGVTDVTGSVLGANHATEFGGALYNDAETTTNVTGSTMESNTSEGMGGALYSAGTATVATSTVRLNTAEQRGGGLYNDGGVLTVTGGTIEQNHCVDENGGGIYSRGTLSVEGVLFEANVTSRYGGGIYAPGSFEEELGFATGCTFRGNFARYGAGLYGAFRVDDCVFEGNVAESYGAGYFATNGSLAIDVTNTVFEVNIAEQGGGMYAGGGFGEPITIAGCLFRGNEATDRNGGGLLITNSPLAVIDCTFDANSCGARGAGLSLSGAIATLDDLVITANSAAGNGGGIRVAGNSVVVMTGCDIVANDGLFAGGLYVHESALTLRQCRILGNVAGAWGGGLYAAFSNFEMTNCTVNGNASSERGGGLHLFWSSPLITNTTIANNVTGQFGGGIFNQADCYPYIANTILWGNRNGGGQGEGAQITDADNSRTTIEYSCVEDWTGGLGGIGNTGADPLFVDPLGADRTAGTRDDDLSLAAGSPLIDAADNDAVPEDVVIDLAGRARFVDDPDTPDTGHGAAPIVDMGAYEVQSACPADVDGDGEIGFSDVLRILTRWGEAGGAEDVDGNGSVGFGDVLAVLARWGSCP